MQAIERTSLDRRSGEDRRVAYDLDYFQIGGKERRKVINRRSQAERRDGWVRIGKWLSVNVQDLNAATFLPKKRPGDDSYH